MIGAPNTELVIQPKKATIRYLLRSASEQINNNDQRSLKERHNFFLICPDAVNKGAFYTQYVRLASPKFSLYFNINLG